MIKVDKKSEILYGAAVAALFTVSACAHRQHPDPGDVRVSLDAEPIGIYGSHAENKTSGSQQEISVVSAGNAASPGSIGIGWAASPRTVLGARLGVGHSRTSVDEEPDTKLTTLAVAPGITLVRGDSPVRLFVELSPILRIGHSSVGSESSTAVAGGGAIAIGMLLFPVEDASLDLGFFFEGTAGGATYELIRLDDSVRLRTLRGGVRLGISIWK
jgi:hypothetical protein